jgi:hypothetical protein
MILHRVIEEIVRSGVDDASLNVKMKLAIVREHFSLDFYDDSLELDILIQFLLSNVA